MKKIAVIGAGASGLMAAYISSEKNSVTVFEKQKKAGRKILVSGNGRCNISNLNLSEAHYHCKDPRFVKRIIDGFGLDKTVSFFHSMGLPLLEGKNGKLFPASLQSSTVLKLFEYELSKRGVELLLHRKIEKIIPKKSGFIIVTAGMESFEFDAVVLAAGSCANSSTGASRSGYELAASLGHTVIEPFPAILPINIRNAPIKKLQGIKWDCGCSVISSGRPISKSEGELLFTSYGISGPAALDISREVNELILKKIEPVIEIDFFPSVSHEALLKKLAIIFSAPDKNIAFSLGSILKERIPEVILDSAGIDRSRRNGSLTSEEKSSLCKTLKALRLIPGKPRDFADAVVAAGGISIDEINPETMESKIVKNLYITGELIDVDGNSGGYNLQFAWSTGAIAGKSLLL